MNYTKYALLVFVLLLLGCSGNKHDSRLIDIASTISDSPQEALTRLDSIDYGKLSEADRHYYDFLSIKATDKAYITHKSDSLILDVIDYYSRNSEDGLYPEALYYGGRVYSDLGNYPTALEFFQQSLDLISEDSSEMLHLKGNVLSQTALLLTELRMYSQAIPYLKEALRIDSIENDTFNLAYDNELLGTILLNSGDLQNAEKTFNKASYWAKFMTDSDVANMQVYQAATRLKMQDVDSALVLIRGITDKVRPMQQNVALIWASDIYLAAGKPDSAYYYANKLIHSEDSNSRKNGYRNLFYPGVFELIPTDSIAPYARNYYTFLEKYYDSHEAEQAIIQDSFYNYQIHLRERNKAEQNNVRLTYLIYILSLTILAVIILVLYLQNRKKRLILTLQATLLKLEELQKSLENISKGTESRANQSYTPSPNLADLKQRLQEQLLQLEQNCASAPIDPRILNSKAFKTITEHLEEKKTISDSSEIWDKLEQTIVAVSPNFKEHLQLLVGKRLKPHYYHLILLIRCGITPTQTMILLGRTKGTISYRRKHVCEIIFGEKIDSHLIDGVIRSI